jgi:hypothetical protein
MLRTDEKFRHFVLRRIRPLQHDALKDYEERLARQCELVQHWEILQYEKGYEQERFGAAAKGYDREKTNEQMRLRNVIKRVEKANARLMVPLAREYAALQALWLARRRLALTSGNFFQLSLQPSKLRRFLAAWLNYRKTQLVASFQLLPNRLNNLFRRHRVPPKEKKPTLRPA